MSWVDTVKVIQTWALSILLLALIVFIARNNRLP